MAIADYDDDGDLDIFVNNYGAGRPALGSPPLYIDHNFLWRNDGDFKFVDVGVETGVAATMRGIGGVQKEDPLVMNEVSYASPIGGKRFLVANGEMSTTMVISTSLLGPSLIQTILNRIAQCFILTAVARHLCLKKRARNAAWSITKTSYTLR